jgi:membrane dipeptidase
MRKWFDAHLDLAYLAENGRDMRRGLADCGGPHLPAAVTFPSLAEGGVAACLGTIFTELGGHDAVAYPAGDVEAAYAAGVRQLQWYHRWVREGVSEEWKEGTAATRQATRGTRVGILMECADPIRLPDELSWWVERGVIAIGLAWGRGSRYATGNMPESHSSGVGLTDTGRVLVREMDRLGVVHDLSHLSDRACDEVLGLAIGKIMASHSNCRGLLSGAMGVGGENHRQLRDDTIREIGKRGGVIGLNLVRNFIRSGLDKANPDDRPSVEDAVKHVEHICEVMGHRRGVGMGSDLDGGMSAREIPAGISAPRDFEKFAEALLRRGWSEEGVDAFAWGNWARFFELN